MLLPTSVTNRRKFLERTALGAGSVLFMPGLLTSCADHRIPDPSTPNTPGVMPPLIGDGPVDWNEQSKSVVVAALSLIPEVGGILSALASIFLPGTTIWDQVKDQVNALIDQKLTDAVYNLAKDNLNTVASDIASFVTAIKDDPKDQMSQAYDNIQGPIKGLVYDFMTSGFEIALLPLFAQYANMHLSLQRDAVIAGKSWGRNDAQRAQDIKDLQTSIFNYVNYAQGKCAEYYDYLSKNVPRRDWLVEPFTSQNKFARNYWGLVLDYATTWPYYDVTQYPNGAKVSFSRELYSDPMGSFGGDKDTPIQLPYDFSPERLGPTNLTVWGSTDGINAVQLTYPAGRGPNGVTTTPRMGRQDAPGGKGSSGTTDQPYGRVLSISANNPILRGRTSTWDYARFGNGVYAMELELKDGTMINKVGGDHTGQWGDWVSIPDHFISSIYIHGAIESIDSPGYTWIADCIVFGFKFLNGKPTVTPRTLERLYITNPRELSGADLAQASPTYGAADALISDNLKAARQAYWAAIAKAKAPK